MFIVLVKSLKANKPLTSDEIAELTKLTRGTVVFHLNRLMQAGIVTGERNRYMLNVSNLEELVNLVENNLKKTFEDLREIARDIDERLEL